MRNVWRQNSASSDAALIRFLGQAAALPNIVVSVKVPISGTVNTVGPLAFARRIEADLPLKEKRSPRLFPRRNREGPQNVNSEILF